MQTSPFLPRKMKDTIRDYESIKSFQISWVLYELYLFYLHAYDEARQ